MICFGWGMDVDITAHLKPFLTTCRKDLVFVLPLAARKPNIVFPYRLPILPV